MGNQTPSSLHHVKKLVIMVLLAVSLTACMGQDPSLTDNQEESDPSRWVTKTWVDNESTSNTRQAKIKVLPKPGWLSSKLTSLTEKATSTGDLWDRVAANFELPHHKDNPAVQGQIAWFLRHPGYLQRTTHRAAPYMYYVFQELQRRHLPAELTLLPVIESAYNPFNYSSRGAAGLWQMMPGTATDLGIRQNWWYDGRRDIFASTNAALDYLIYLHDYFNGNWLLALAAYNSGPGTVQAAIRKNARLGKPTDFWSLPLPQQTQAYVPQLLALASIVKDRHDYPLHLPVIDDHPYLTQVDVGAQIDLAHAAQLAGMTLPELRQLNPGYKSAATDPTGPHVLILPIDKINHFKQNLANLGREERLTWHRYKVRHNDTIAQVAERFDTTPRAIRQMNQLTGNRLRPGKTLLVPINTVAVSTRPGNTFATREVISAPEETTAPSHETVSAPEETPASPTSAQEVIIAAHEEDGAVENASDTQAVDQQKKMLHTVKANETLETIAKRYQVSTEDLQAWNDLRTEDDLVTGSTLEVWANADAALPQQVTETVTEEITKTVATTKHYTVRRGDTLHKIARRYHVSEAQLRKTNHLKSSALKPGKVLTIPSKARVAHAPSKTIQKTRLSTKHRATTHRKTYKIKSGDTLYSIAKRNGVSTQALKRLNKISDKARLHPGQVIVVG